MEPWVHNQYSMAHVEPQPVGMGQAAELRTELIPRQSPRAGLGDLYRWAAVAGTALGAYHGYRRTGSVAWAFGWSLFAGAMPIFAIPLAFAQGFGKKKGRS